MKIEYFHASKYGNGARIAEEFKREMALKGSLSTFITSKR
jgi:hypothetical protein